MRARIVLLALAIVLLCAAPLVALPPQTTSTDVRFILGTWRVDFPGIRVATFSFLDNGTGTVSTP